MGGMEAVRDRKLSAGRIHFYFPFRYYFLFVLLFGIPVPRTINKGDLGGHHSLEIILFNYSFFLERFFLNDLFVNHVFVVFAFLGVIVRLGTLLMVQFGLG